MEAGSRRAVQVALLVTAAALALNFGIGLKLGISRKMDSDAYYYFQLGKSLSEGRGYTTFKSFWPDQPATQRMPAWPAVAAASMKLMPWVKPTVAMRVAALTLNAVAAGLLALLTCALLRKPAAGVIAGAAYALHPVGISCMYEGLSEPLFMVLALSGTLLLLRSGWGCMFEDNGRDGGWRRTAGFLGGLFLLGLAALDRANFILWGPIAAALGGCIVLAIMPRRLPRFLVVAGSGLVVFLLPAFSWTVRNYHVCGAFPVLSTLRGQTFYGGNNPVVSDPGKYWGYWVFPNEIPGEPTLLEMSKTMSEYEVDCYYYGRGKDYVRDNIGKMPRLLLGKLVRAYVPVPWSRLLSSYAVCAFRALLFIAALAGLFAAWRTISPAFRLIFLAMALTNVATVLIFYGYTRFAFPLDAYLAVFAGAGCGMLWALWCKHCSVCRWIGARRSAPAISE